MQQDVRGNLKWRDSFHHVFPYCKIWNDIPLFNTSSWRGIFFYQSPTAASLVQKQQTGMYSNKTYPPCRVWWAVPPAERDPFNWSQWTLLWHGTVMLIFNGFKQEVVRQHSNWHLLYTLTYLPLTIIYTFFFFYTCIPCKCTGSFCLQEGSPDTSCNRETKLP